MAELAVVTEPEVKEITAPPTSENGTTAEEVVDHPDTVDAEEEEHEGPTPLEVRMDTTTPVIEESEFLMVENAPTHVAQEPESPGDQPKKSYASIVRDLFLSGLHEIAVSIKYIVVDQVLCRTKFIARLL